MNIIRELRKKKGIQQKELAIAIGVSCPTVSAWESNKKDPSGERLNKLAKYFNVDELVILGRAQPPLFIPEDPNIVGKSETEQIIERLLEKLDQMPKTTEARIVSGGMDRLPKDQREKLLNVFTALYPELIKEGDDNAT